MKKRVGLLMAVVCLAVFGLAGNAGAAKFLFQDLSNDLGAGSRPAGINDAGQIAGVTSTYSVAFLWTQGKGLQNLGTLGGSFIGVAGVNNSGQVVGTSNNYAYLWTSAMGMQQLGTAHGRANGINDAGQVVGEASFGTNWHGFFYTLGGGMQDLTPLETYSSARAINKSGQIAGLSGDMSYLSLLFLGQAPQVLYSDGGFAYPAAMNSQGNIVGEADLDHLGGMGQAFFYDLKAGVMTNLTPGDYGGRANSINDANQVIGDTGMNSPFQFSAFFWSPSTGLKELNKLVVNLPAGVKLQSAAGINNKGQIVGITSSGQPFLLSPTASPLPPLGLLLD